MRDDDQRTGALQRAIRALLLILGIQRGEALIEDHRTGTLQ